MTTGFSAPAKVNLALRVVGRRPDGHHLLETVMTFFPLFDRLEITPGGDGIHLRCDPPVTGRTEENLVFRAAETLRQAGGGQRGARIHLHKRIPHGAGLGGGSSDAATTLLALNALWGLGLATADLIDIGVGLGADVPVFLGGHAALCEGVGERLTPLPDLPEAELLLVNPGVALPTPTVFRTLAGQWPAARAPMALPPSGRSENWSLHGLLENDLQPVATRLAPVIGEVAAALATRGAMATLMSGSGSSLFGLFSDAHSAADAIAGLTVTHPHWSVWRGRTFNTHPFAKEWKSRVSSTG